MGIVDSQLLFKQEGDHFPVCLARHLHFSSLGWPTYHARLKLTLYPKLMPRLIPGMDTMVVTTDTDPTTDTTDTDTDTGVERRGKLKLSLPLPLKPKPKPIPGMDTMAVTTDTEDLMVTTDLTDMPTGVR